jgi:hypothetical protein
MRQRLAVRKIASMWGSKLSRELGPPAGVLLFMRKGYLKGKRAIRRCLPVPAGQTESDLLAWLQPARVPVTSLGAGPYR